MYGTFLFGSQSGTIETSLLMCTRSAARSHGATSRVGCSRPSRSIIRAVPRVSAVVPVIASDVRRAGSMLRTAALPAAHSGTVSADPGSGSSGWRPSTDSAFHAGTSASAGTIAQCVASRTGRAPGASVAGLPGPSSGASAAAVSADAAIAIAGPAPAASPRHAASSASRETSCTAVRSGAISA